MDSLLPARWAAAVLACIALLHPADSIAANGMNMIGYGAESIAMGGADLAVTASPSAMNINPAGIGLIRQAELDLGFGFMDPSLRHTDRFDNDRRDELDRYPMPYLGYARPWGETLSIGIGLFVQGGMGAEYQGLVTPFAAMRVQSPPGFFSGDSVPAADATRTNVMHAKLTPTVAWRVHPAVTVGASLNLSYSRAELELFPETSVLADLDRSGMAGDSPGDAFFGMAGEDLSAFGVGLRLGVQYRRGALALAAVYSTETELDYDGGSMALNLSALGLGKVTYDCKMSGFTWPRQAGAGLAYRFTPAVLVAADVDWVNWASAIETVTIDIANPDRAMAPPARQIPMRMGWRDQWVWAFGMEIRAGQRWAWRVGLNHGDSPIPASMMRPLFPAIAEDHVTAGLGYARGSWILDFAVEHVLEVDKTNDSRDPAVNPFGPGSSETLSQLVTHFMVRRKLGS